MNKFIPSINQVLLFRDPTYSNELGEALWTATKEVENFYNLGEQRAVFRRSYLSDVLPKNIKLGDSELKLSFLRSILDYMAGRTEQKAQEATSEVSINVSQSDSKWKTARGKYIGTYDVTRILNMVRELASNLKSDEIPIVVTDLMLTPPPALNYVIWDGDENGLVISIPPTDPGYWRIIDPDRIASIKHRVRTAFLACVGELIGLKECDNERCFLFKEVGSASSLDWMVLLGPEHNIEALTQRGFENLSSDPIKVQPIIENAEPEEMR
jgi:hypothetical protein